MGLQCKMKPFVFENYFSYTFGVNGSDSLMVKLKQCS